MLYYIHKTKGTIYERVGVNRKHGYVTLKEENGNIKDVDYRVLFRWYDEYEPPKK